MRDLQDEDLDFLENKSILNFPYQIIAMYIVPELRSLLCNVIYIPRNVFHYWQPFYFVIVSLHDVQWLFEKSAIISISHLVQIRIPVNMNMRRHISRRYCISRIDENWREIWRDISIREEKWRYSPGYTAINEKICYSADMLYNQLFYRPETRIHTYHPLHHLGRLWQFPMQFS